MTIRIRFRPRPVAVRQSCAACETRRQWLRANGIRQWAPYRASCVACTARHDAIAAPACRHSGTGDAESLALSA